MNYKLVISNYASIDEAFASIPSETTYLDLSDNNFGNMHAEQLVALRNVYLIYPNITQLNLSSVKLDAPIADNLSIITKALTRIFPNITYLNLGVNNIGGMNKEQLTAIIDGFGAYCLQELNLRSNHLSIMPKDNYLTLMSANLGYGSLLNLSDNYLSFIYLGNIIELFKCISINVTKLDLSFNHLNMMGTDKLTFAVNSIHSNLNSLSLKGNKLCIAGTIALSELGEYIYRSYNHEVLKGLTFTMQHITTHHVNLNSLDLSENDLFQLDFFVLKAILESIAGHVKYVNLQKNKLFEYKNNIQIDKFLKGLGNVRARQRLDLRRNGESEMARAIVPLIQMSLSSVLRDSNTRIPFDMVGVIASFLQTNIPAKLVVDSIKTTSEKIQSKLRHQLESTNLAKRKLTAKVNRNPLRCAKKSRVSDEQPSQLESTDLEIRKPTAKVKRKPLRRTKKPRTSNRQPFQHVSASLAKCSPLRSTNKALNSDDVPSFAPRI